MRLAPLRSTCVYLNDNARYDRPKISHELQVNVPRTMGILRDGFNVLPQSSVMDHIKHATCVAKFIQLMCLDLLRILQQTSATASRVSVP